MKSNFHLKSRKEDQALHIHLYGIFDGASAFELIQAIRRGASKAGQIFIDTGHLTQTLPFGRSVLDTHLPKSGLRNRLTFTGPQAGELLPQGCILLAPGRKTGHHCNGNCENCVCGPANTGAFHSGQGQPAGRPR